MLLNPHVSLPSSCRLQRLEESLSSESGISESQKEEKRVAHATKETEFLRLKRSRLGVDDFDPLKVIGKGAFGEVCTVLVLRMAHRIWSQAQLGQATCLAVA